MKNFLGFRCSICSKSFSFDQVVYTCPNDGGNLDVILDSQTLSKRFKPADLFAASETSIWRYLPLLPVDDPGLHSTPIRHVGYTPIFTSNKLSELLHLNHLVIKDESRNPTASFKDRASAVVVAKALEIGAKIVVTASTGNAGAALAGMSAAAGQKAVIFAPRLAPPAKIAQLLIYGANVFLVDGSYDDAFDLSIKASDYFGWYCRNTGYNPFTIEGKKTAAFEIWEYLQRFSTGDPTGSVNIFVSVGDGNIISGLYKGFQELCDLGWLNSMPRLYGVQAEGSSAIANAFYANRDQEIIPVSANTIADSIAVDYPRDGVRAVRAIRNSKGSPIIVSDEEILSAISDLGKVGIFSEPAGAASFAGVKKAVSLGKIEATDTVITINTGSGLKDIRAAMMSVKSAPIIEPTLDALKKMVKY